MPKLTKIPGRPNYYAWVTDPATGRKKRVSTRERNQRTASVVAERAERSAHSAYTSTTFDEASDAFLVQRAALKSKATQDFYRKKLGTLARLLGSARDLGSITASVVDKFIATRLGESVSRNTIGKELTALRGVLKLARRHKQFPVPLDEVLPETWDAGYEPRSRWVTEAEAWAIIKALPGHRGAVVTFILATGARLGEALRAQREDVSTDKSQVALRGTKTKGARRIAPVLPWGAPFLEYALVQASSSKGQPMFLDWEKAMRWDLKRVCDALKIPGVSANDLRRTYAQWLRHKGVDPSLVGVTLGHADSRMVERVYGRVPPEKLRGLIEAQISSYTETGHELSERAVRKALK